jgi:thymidylate kinase
LSVERKAMPTLEELVQTSANELVVLCQRVADNRGAYLPAAAEEAAKLKLEWENLRMPPNLNYVLQTRIEQQKDRLRRRMIGFLAAVL